MTTCGTNQCCANITNSRCINLAINGSRHCELHRTKATSLYLKYKNFSNYIDTMNIHKHFDNINKKINHVLNCYIMLNNAFDARLKHRKYAFVPECYDSGHDYQFIKLKEQITECEYLLDELYEQDNENTSESSSSLSGEDNQNTLVIYKNGKSKRITELRLYREQQERDIESSVSKYIEDNKIILQRRSMLAYNISTCINKLYEGIDDNDDIHLFVKWVTLFHLAWKLQEIGYFLKDFKPDRCKDITCGCYVPYNVGLACGCIYDNNNVEKYANLSDENTLKLFYEILLLNKEKILPLIHDVVALYHKLGGSVLALKAHLVWNVEQKRLVLEPNTEKEPEKVSKIMASARLKNKYFQRKVNAKLLEAK